MTPGHKHRTVRIHAGAHPLTRVAVRLLQSHLRETTNSNQAKRSRWVWGRIDVGERGYPAKYDRSPAPSPHVYVLTPLSVLHTLVGLTLDVEPGAWFTPAPKPPCR